MQLELTLSKEQALLCARALIYFNVRGQSDPDLKSKDKILANKAASLSVQINTAMQNIVIPKD